MAGGLREWIGHSTPTRLFRGGEAKQPHRGHALVSITMLGRKVGSLIQVNRR
jgi:hypothetical protein